jgi:hypothetical protein
MTNTTAQNPHIDFERLRDNAIRDSFGGPATYALLKERNPQIDVILNAGIAAGVDAQIREIAFDAFSPRPGRG